MGVIYCATNRINGKMYIGLTTQSMARRRTAHEKRARNGSQSMFYNAMRKHGANAFSWKILDTVVDRKELYLLERVYIDLFDTYNLGYNLTHGGDGSHEYIYTEEERLQRSTAYKKRPRRKEELALLASYQKGVKQSESHVNQRLTHPNSLARFRKIMQFTLDGQFVQEWGTLTDAKQGMGAKSETSIFDACNSKASTAHGYRWFYKEDTPYIMRPLGPCVPKPVVQYDLDMRYIAEFFNIVEASKATGANKSGIGLVCKGGKKSAGGFIWKYKYPDINGDNPRSIKRVLQYSLDNVFLKEWKSVLCASKALGIYSSGIARVCSGKRNTAGGFGWKYKEND